MQRATRILLILFTLITQGSFSFAQLLTWNFPINRTHAGILLGNGTQGLMVWGTDTLNITVGHAGFWDHRGGNDFASRTTYKEVKSLVDVKDEAKIRSLFSIEPKPNEPARPWHLSAGVCQVILPAGYRLQKGVLNIKNGVISITVNRSKGNPVNLTIEQSTDKNVAWVKLPAELKKARVQLKPFYDYISSPLAFRGIAPPSKWNKDEINGFTQSLPKDPPLSMAVQSKGGVICIATTLGTESKMLVEQLIVGTNIPLFTTNKLNWWKQYWSEVSEVVLPDPMLQEIVNYGLYKQACATPPQGIACTLQGPFMEEYQLAPWNNDYHFNINEQLIYTPALASNRTSHFKPLLQLIDSLLPVFHRNGKLFFQNDKAYMFPHAVDDRGQAIGNYWGGTIDHATTAWVAYLLWQYYQYSGDTAALRKTVYPLLVGAFEGFNVMLETVKDSSGNDRFSLPLSVSPEYGSGLQGVGRDASFQLAALHKILSILPEAAAVLGEQKNERWALVQKTLPLYTTVNSPYGESNAAGPARIGLWQGKDLEISHRHHSHLASIYPFKTIEPFTPQHNTIAEKSYWKWVHTGAGGWTGWCIPWASIIHGRMGKTEAAVSWLYYWKQNFVNEGRGTLHNATNNGMSVMNEPVWQKGIPGSRNHEIMQLDAGFGAVSAVLDLLVQERPDGVHILPNRHWQWKELSFKRIRTAGGFLIDCNVVNDQVQKIIVNSTIGGAVTIFPRIGRQVLLNGKQVDGGVLNLTLKKGEVAVIESIDKLPLHPSL
jgi:hypothetical protein